MARSDLEEYQKQLKARLATIAPVFAKASIGDFSGIVEIPEQDDELTEFFVGVQIVLEAIREKVSELETTVDRLKFANDIIDNEKARVEAILDSLGESLVTVDPAFHISFANEPAIELLGEKAKILGQEIDELFLIEDETGKLLSKTEHPILRAIAEGKHISVGLTTKPHYYLHRKNMQKKRIAFTVRPIKRASKASGAVVAFRDITEESNMDRTKTEIISIASHQLRTPLTAIRWYAQELISPKMELTAAKQEEYLRQVQTSNERMIELVDHLLNVSRIDLGTLALHPEAVDVHEILQELLQDMAPHIHAKQLRIHKVMDKKLPRALIDPNSMRAIFQNLISNAVKYSPPGREITVSLEHKPEGLLLKVKDRGCGIPEDQKERIFTKLFRADNAKKIASDGSGLGLYITKAMVEQSGGKIWFDSIEGRGSTFYVIIPSVNH